jgi:hypothetical protein
MYTLLLELLWAGRYQSMMQDPLMRKHVTQNKHSRKMVECSVPSNYTDGGETLFNVTEDLKQCDFEYVTSNYKTFI